MTNADLIARPKLVEFLEEAARAAQRRALESGEDSAHWAGMSNANLFLKAAEALLYAPSGVVAEIAAERLRQIEAEGWTTAHDDKHSRGEMAKAAACYAVSGKCMSNRYPAVAFIANQIWPWDLKWWKPKDKRRDLIRAAALIIAEVERLDRAALPSRS